MVIEDGRLFSWRERFNDREVEVEAQGRERFASVLYGVHVVDGNRFAWVELSFSVDGIGIGVNGVKGFGFKDGNTSITLSCVGEMSKLVGWRIDVVGVV